jgi:hypothetical protein
VNEAESDPSLNLAKQPVTLRENPTESTDPLDEIFPALPIMMNVNFHVGDAGASHLPERIEDLRMILFRRIEEGVPGLGIVVIGTIRGDSGPAVAPGVDPAERRLNISVVIEGFVVIGDGEPHVPQR